MTWHPILAARETEPGHWWMIDELGAPYGDIRFVRRGDQLGYHALFTDGTGTPIQDVGYFTTLRRSTWEVHAVFLRSHGAPNRSSYGA
jgi:hypothetical protein